MTTPESAKNNNKASKKSEVDGNRNHNSFSEGQTMADRLRADDLVERLSKTIQQLGEANQRENEARTEFVRLERDQALVRHEMKECTRRVEQERTEMRKKLDGEINTRTKEQNSNQHVVENISNLEKERGKLPERLNKEQENVEKLKKSVAELQVAQSSGEAAKIDLSDKLGLVAVDEVCCDEAQCQDVPRTITKQQCTTQDSELQTHVPDQQQLHKSVTYHEGLKIVCSR